MDTIYSLLTCLGDTSFDCDYYYIVDNKFGWIKAELSPTCVISILIVLLLNNIPYFIRKRKLKDRNEINEAICIKEQNAQLKKFTDRYLQATDAEIRNIPFNRRWNLIRKEIDRIHNHFTKRLEIRFPGINENEIRLCCLIRIGMNTQEITQRMNLSKGNVRIRKWRLSKTLKIRNNRGQLEQFIWEF